MNVVKRVLYVKNCIKEVNVICLHKSNIDPNSREIRPWNLGIRHSYSHCVQNVYENNVGNKWIPRLDFTSISRKHFSELKKLYWTFLLGKESRNKCHTVIGKVCFLQIGQEGKQLLTNVASRVSQ